MAIDRERLSERLAAVERRLTDADPDEDGGGLADVAAIEGRLSDLESRADDLDARLGDVESGLQALRGYVGGVDAVDEAVERRANAALAKAERLEARLDGDPALDGVTTDDRERATGRMDADDGSERADGGEAGADGGQYGRATDRDGGRGGSDGERRDPDDRPHPPETIDGSPDVGADGSFDGATRATAVDAGSSGTDEGEDRRLVDRLRDAL